MYRPLRLASHLHSGTQPVDLTLDTVALAPPSKSILRVNTLGPVKLRVK